VKTQKTIALAVVAFFAANAAAVAAARPLAAKEYASGYGMMIAADGWHIRITRGTVEASTAPLPKEGRWIARRLSRSLHRGDLGVLLFEDAPRPGVPPVRSIYRRGAPRPFTRTEFGGPPSGGTNVGRHLFARRNFTVAGRLFDLFIETGGGRPSVPRLTSLNRLVASLRLTRGDFYAGAVTPATFFETPGWVLRASSATGLAPETSTATAIRHSQSAAADSVSGVAVPSKVSLPQLPCAR
jgi:hypothetical protein